jgi:ElaB/YqjD/DUF883 family membrane-anchored ribosome-binding protein
MPLPPERRGPGDRRDKNLERAEAEAAKPLQSRRTNSPAQAKREMERSRAEIEATIEAMKSKVAGEVHDVKRVIDAPRRLRDTVRSDPWGSLAIAAGVGLGLALLTSGKRGYDKLTKDEIREIRAFRKERRRHLVEIEELLERSARREARPTLRDRIRARLAAARDRE